MQAERSRLLQEIGELATSKSVLIGYNIQVSPWDMGKECLYSLIYARVCGRIIGHSQSVAGFVLEFMTGLAKAPVRIPS